MRGRAAASTCNRPDSHCHHHRRRRRRHHRRRHCHHHHQHHCNCYHYHHDWDNAGPGWVSHPAVPRQVLHQSAPQSNSKVQHKKGWIAHFIYKRSCVSICVSRFSEDLASAPAFQGGSTEPLYQVGWILRWNHVKLFCEKKIFLSHEYESKKMHWSEK